MKRRALTLFLILGIALGAAAAAPGSPQPATTKATTTVTVSMFEMGFKLSKLRVPRGTVVFRVVNNGKVEHDFRISGKGTRMLAAGERATLKVVFRKPGKVSFICTAEGHAVAGMIGKLTVR